MWRGTLGSPSPAEKLEQREGKPNLAITPGLLSLILPRCSRVLWSASSAPSGEKATEVMTMLMVLRLPLAACDEDEDGEY